MGVASHDAVEGVGVGGGVLVEGVGPDILGLLMLGGELVGWTLVGGWDLPRWLFYHGFEHRGALFLLAPMCRRGRLRMGGVLWGPRCR